VQSLVEQKEFREDLWYRISVFPIRLPPLRERKQDIPALARHFAASAGRRLHGTPLVPSATDLELLAAWDWPGNVRELAAVIERAAILGNAEGLDVATALGPTPPARVPGASGSLEDVSRRTIEAALDRANGKIEGPTGAAHILGVNPSTLRSKMQRLGIQWSRYRG
jgi:transcriptional regulator with GAF, ATPase, and Fis domain